MVWAIKVFNCIFENVKPLDTPRWRRGSQRRRSSGETVRERQRQRERENQDQRRSKFELSLMEIADHLYGDLNIQYPASRIRFTYKKTQFTAWLQQKYGSQIIRVTARWPEPNFRLKVFPDDNRRNSKYRGIEDIEVGDGSFDRDFVVQGNDINGVTQILSRKVTKRIRRHWKSAHGRIDIDLGGGTITFGGKSNRILRNLQVVAIIQNFAKIHCEMLESFSGFQPDDFVQLEMTYVEQHSSTCMICGVEVGDRGAVDCAKCNTRHHKDCWDYNGRCSTYGCHSRRAK